VFSQGTHNLKGEPQPGLRVAVDLASGDPAIDSPRVLHTADICSQLPPDNFNQFLNDLCGGKSQRLPVGE
jgi:hypothetical protein